MTDELMLKRMLVMASTSDLMKDHPNPTEIDIPTTCQRCVHFSRLPLYSVNGSRLLCSHPSIGRDPGDHPCVNFAPDMLAYMDLPTEVHDQLNVLLLLVEDTARFKGRIAEAHISIMHWLRVASNMSRLGLPFYSKVAFMAGAPPERKVGHVMWADRKRAMVRLKNGIVYHVETERIERIVTKAVPATQPKKKVKI